MTNKIKNIIFDWGGVLLRIDIVGGERVFAKLIGRGKFTFFKAPVFNLFETGQISAHEFYDGLKAEFNFSASDLEIETAWNAVIIEAIAENIEILKSFQGKYRLFLLSNTNETHVRATAKLRKETFGPFEKVYFSQDLHLRKPDPAIYQYVLSDAGIIASESLFVDDHLPNVEAAKSLGFETIHLIRPEVLGSELARIL